MTVFNSENMVLYKQIQTFAELIDALDDENSEDAFCSWLLGLHPPEFIETLLFIMYERVQISRKPCRISYKCNLTD